ncbi:Exonuclease 1, partial [Ananas comosus]
MGIQNLLRFMRPFIEPVHIKKYSGKRVGIDAYSWMHKGAYSCSMELCLGSQCDVAKRYLKYFMHHINLLRHYNVIPVVVFDGGNTPSKSATEDERHRQVIVWCLFKDESSEFRKAVQITPSMAHQLIQILRSESVEFVVAPYEADAQLAYLATLEADQGGITAVITEDSDLIAYGCKSIIFKMDRFGNGEEFLMDRIFSAVTEGLSFKHFDKEMFTGMCVLAGCDFLPSIPGIGTKRAYSLVSKYKNLDRVLSVLKLDKKYRVPEDYSDSFGKAIAIFHHARIYDVETKALKHLKPLEQKYLQYLNGDLDLLGPELPSSMAAAIAEGNLNPITMEAFNQTPAAESCAAFDHIDKNESQTSSAEESCITILSDLSRNQDIIGKSTIEKLFTTCGSYNAIDEISLDKNKYMKEALALTKLIAPSRCNQEVENKVEWKEIPKNNPFKKRKLENQQQERQNITESASVLTNVEQAGTVWSQVSQESVESKPMKKLLIDKQEISKKARSRNGRSNAKSERN